MTTTIYGISNCDTVRKARKWLTEHEVDASFHDFRKQGLEASKVDDWCEQVGLDTLLNKRGTTWRGLSDQQKALSDEAALKALLLEYPALIKRPVLEHNNTVCVGFKAEQYAELFGA